VCQVLVDFTGNVHLRHPFDVGGALWLTTIVQGQLSCIVGALVYWQYYAGVEKIAAAYLFAIVSALLLLTVASSLGLRFLMQPTHVRTFYSSQTGSEFSLAQFLDNDEDEARIKIFGTNESLWRPIRREVKEWVQGNYGKWKDKPWFTDVIRSRIPAEFLPQERITPDA
jgi:hypothetical protein